MLRQAVLFSMAAMLGSTVNPAHSDQTNPGEPSKANKIYMEYCFSCHEFGAVSYTHLTLPTICSV